MAQNSAVERMALNAYYKEKGLSGQRNKKLDELLNDQKWKRYEKKRDKLFPDYATVLKKLADNHKKEINSTINQFDKLVQTGLSDCDKTAKGLQTKSTACNDSINKLNANLKDCEQQTKNAKGKLKLIDKIANTLASKSSQDQAASNKYSKALTKVQPLKEKANAALKVVQDNLSATQKDKKRLEDAQKKIASETNLNNEILEKLRLSEKEIKTHKKEFTDLQNKDASLIINSDLQKKINHSEGLKKLAQLSENAKKSLTKLNEIDTSFLPGRIIQKNKTAVNKISGYISKANAFWIAIPTTEEIDFLDTQPFYAYYEGIRIYPSSNPSVKGVARNPFLKNDLETAYNFVKKKGDLVKIPDIGWCRLDAFYTQKEKDRRQYLDDYNQWLSERYNEMLRLKGVDKLRRIQGILSQSETVIKNFKRGVPKAIQTLDKAPALNRNNSQTTCPHEIIHPLRAWIELTEKKIRTVKEETNSNENAGSLYSDTDWNSQLKIPQYRTQSDNLISPETTCAPTTFTMMAERAGWSRSDIITAIEKQFSNTGLTNITDAWKKQGQLFLKWINKQGSKNYQKVRGGKIRDNKFDELAKNFKQFGQYEDLTIFYHFLLNGASKTSINSNEHHNDQLRQGLEHDGNFKKMGSYKYVQKNKFKSDMETRTLVKKHLDRGNVVMFSIFHKGSSSNGTHNYFVQSINSRGFIIDDPFGMSNEEYRRDTNVVSDLYKDKGGKKHRDNYDFKNRPDFNILKKDFTTQAAQNLGEKESRGDSTLLTWKMLTESDNKIIKYVVIWEKKRL